LDSGTFGDSLFPGAQGTADVDSGMSSSSGMEGSGPELF
jgi:hypothetical protein